MARKQDWDPLGAAVKRAVAEYVEREILAVMEAQRVNTRYAGPSDGWHDHVARGVWRFDEMDHISSLGGKIKAFVDMVRDFGLKELRPLAHVAMDYVYDAWSA